MFSCILSLQWHHHKFKSKTFLTKLFYNVNNPTFNHVVYDVIRKPQIGKEKGEGEGGEIFLVKDFVQIYFVQECSYYDCNKCTVYTNIVVITVMTIALMVVLKLYFEVYFEAVPAII